MLSSEYYYLAFIGLITYFLGNISPSTIIGRLNGIDIKKEGSGNAGTTNALRVLGAKAAVATLVIDILKGYIAVRIGLNFGDYGAMVAFSCVVVGHIFPIIYKFKGGKGVATSFGAALSLDWPSAFALLLIALMVTFLSKKMSLGSITAAIAYPFLIWYYYPAVLPIAIPLAVLIVVMHRGNIRRLIKGEEPSLNIIGKIKEKLDQDPSTPKSDKPDSAVLSKDADVASVNAKGSTADAVMVSTNPEAFEKSNESEKTEATPETNVSKVTNTSEQSEICEETNACKEPENEKKEAEAEENEELRVTETLAEAVPEEDDSCASAESQEPKDYFADVVIQKMKDSERKKIAVIDDSPAGLALANRFLYQSHNAIYYIPNKETMKQVNESKTSELLPGVLLNKRLRFTANIKTAVHNRDFILINPENKQYWGSCKKALAKENPTVILFLSDTKPTIPSDIKKHKYVCLESSIDATAVAHNQEVELSVIAKDQNTLERVQETLKDDRLKIITR